MKNLFSALNKFSLLFLILIVLFNSPTEGIQKDSQSRIYDQLTSIPSTAQQVKVGVYAQNVYGLDPESNTYYMDFYIWFNWKGSINPTEKLELMNGVEDWGVTMANAYEEPKQLGDSSFYQLVRVESRFRESFEFSNFPLDKQRLGITIENSVHPLDELVYIADTSGSGYASDLSIPGWQFQKYQMINLYHRYSTNFGDPDLGKKTSTYSAMRFELMVSRPANYFIWKLLLPLIIILFAIWGGMLLSPVRVDSRVLMPITALLTAVFLQQSYSDALPAVSYLVLLDKIYVLSYLIIIATMMEIIYTAGLVTNDSPEVTGRVKKIDRFFLITSTIVFVFGIVLLLLKIL